MTEAELIAENTRLRKIAAHVPARIYIKAKEDAGFGTAIVTDWVVNDPATVDQSEAKLVRLLNGIRALRRYVLVEGQPDEACKKMIGFAYDAQQWGFSADPEYEASEALEACEKWLHDELDKLLAVVGGEAT